jgi:hypothetical protein
MAQHSHLQVVMYHWSEADKSMVYASIAKGKRQDYPASATAYISTGALNRLPLEIIDNVLGHLDISTIGSVRCLNWNSRLTVDLFPPYRDLATHTSSVLRILYSTHLVSLTVYGSSTVSLRTIDASAAKLSDPICPSLHVNAAASHVSTTQRWLLPLSLLLLLHLVSPRTR